MTAMKEIFHNFDDSMKLKENLGDNNQVWADGKGTIEITIVLV